MAVKPTMKTSLSFMLAKLEATRGVDPNPTPAADAFLVGTLDVQLSSTPLTRNVFRRSFSPVPAGVGRKVVKVTFSHEIKGSGDVGTTRPKLGTLFRACGMREMLVTSGAATQIETPTPFGVVTNGPVASWAKTAAPTSLFGSYRVKVVTAGASATAAVQVSRWESGEADATVCPNTRNDARTTNSSGTTLALVTTDLTSLTFTVAGTPVAGDMIYAIVGGLTFEYTVTAADAGSATPVNTIATALASLINADARLAASATGAVITTTFISGAAVTTVTSGTTAVALGASGATITPTWTGSLVVGQEWIVLLYEAGYMYRPTSDSANAESITIYVYKDGVLHKVTSCSGTVTFQGDGGKPGLANFDLSGNYLDPVEEPTPLTFTLEQTDPPQVELAQMSIAGDNDFCAQSFTYTLANATNPKDCVNSADGIDGYQITGRQPTAAFNPEATYEAYTGMWKNFSTAAQFPLHTRVGSTAGNIVRFYAPRANYTGLTYGDRNNAVILDAAFQLNGLTTTGDDELRIAFT